MEQRLLALGALLLAASWPCRGAPAPPLPRCPQATPPGPAPTTPPLPPDCDPQAEVTTGGGEGGGEEAREGRDVTAPPPADVTAEGTKELEATQDPEATLDPVTEDPCAASTRVRPSGTSQGGDKVLVATPGGVPTEGTKELEATQDPKAPLDLVTKALCDATTKVGPSGTSQGGDKVLVATPGGVTMEGTKELEATQDPGTTLDPVTEAPPDATTKVGPLGTSQGGDKVLEATPRDFTMEGTKELEATQDPKATLDPATEAPPDATTVLGPLGTSQGGDKVLVATPGDVTMEGTKELEATQDPGTTLDPVTEAPPDATTVVGPLGTSQGGDKVLVATPGEVTMEGTKELEATQDPGTTLDPVTEAPPDATTVVGPLGTSQGGDKVLVATPGEVTMEGTKELEATQDPGTTLDPVTEAPPDATTVVGPLGTSQGGDKVLVATPGDVTMEGTKELEATQDPEATLDPVTEDPCAATTRMRPSGTSQGGDKVLVATPGGGPTEGTKELEATQDPKATLDLVTKALCEATTKVGPLGTSQGGDKVLVATPGDVTMEGTKELEATQDPGTTLDPVTEAPPDATTKVGPLGTSQGGDKVLVATPRDVTMEGTKELEATQDPGTTLDPVTEAPPDATTVVGPLGTSQGGDKVLVATPGDVTTEGTKELEATQDPKATLDPVTEAPPDATTVVGPLGTSQGGDKVLVATPRDVTMEGAKELEATQDPKATLDPVTEDPCAATTRVRPSGTSQGGDKVLVATPGGGPTEGTKELEATQDPKAPLELVTKALCDATTGVGPSGTSQGGDRAAATTPGEVATEGTKELEATQDPGTTLDPVTEAPPDATTVLGPLGTSQGGDKVLVATPRDVTTEGTKELEATQDPKATLDPVTEAPPESTPGVGPSGTPQGGDKAMVTPGGDLLLGATQAAGASSCPREAPGEERTTPGAVPRAQGCDGAGGAQGGDLLLGGSAQPPATRGPGGALDPGTAAPPEVTTPVGPAGTSQGEGRAATTPPSDVTAEAANRLEATQAPGSTLDPVTAAPLDAVGPSGTSQGEGRAAATPPSDVTVEAANRLEATQAPKATPDPATEAPPQATTPAGPAGTSQGEGGAAATPPADVTAEAANQPQATQAPPRLAPSSNSSSAAAGAAGDVRLQSPPLGCGHALPVTLGPPAGVAKGGSAPRPSAGLLLLLPLPLLLR